MKFEDLDFEKAIEELRIKDVWNISEIKDVLKLENDLDAVKILLYMSELGLIKNDATKISVHPYALIKLIWSEDAERMITTEILKRKSSNKMDVVN